MSTSNRHRFSLVLVGVAVALAAGCAGEPDAGEDAALSEAHFGLMSISYERDWGDAAQALLLKTHAQFVHYTAMDVEQVARLLALPLDPSRDLPGEDLCKVYDLTLDLDRDPLDRQHEEPGNVELLEAGDLHVKTSKGAVTLRPRQFPGLLPFISGVVYAEAQSTEEDRPGPVAVATRGGEAVGAFQVEASSPQFPRLLRVATKQPGEEVRLRQGMGLKLEWQSGMSGTDDDMMYVELRYSKGERELALRCQPRDDGAFEIPAGLVGQTNAARLTLELVRLRRTFFDATGLDRGELRVTVREKATLLNAS